MGNKDGVPCGSAKHLKEYFLAQVTQRQKDSDEAKRIPASSDPVADAYFRGFAEGKLVMTIWHAGKSGATVEEIRQARMEATTGL